jgi:N-carbamoylputrescine amidase
MLGRVSDFHAILPHHISSLMPILGEDIREVTMQESFRIALLQLAWLGDIDSMKVQYRNMIGEAVERGSNLVCLPELSLNPYFPGTRSVTGFDWAEEIPDGVSECFFREMAREYHITLVGSIYECAPDGGLFDTATIHSPTGDLIGATRKVHIPSGPAYHETDFFAGGETFPVFNIGPLLLSTPTCYDQWFPELARICSLNGAELIIYPTAIGGDANDREIDYRSAWETVMCGHAIANGIFVAAINRVGMENGVTFFGSSFVCDPMGNVLAQAGQSTTEVVVADLTPAAIARWRGIFPLLHQRRPETYQSILKKWSGDAPPDWMENTPIRRVKPGRE